MAKYDEGQSNINFVCTLHTRAARPGVSFTSLTSAQYALPTSTPGAASRSIHPPRCIREPDDRKELFSIIEQLCTELTRARNLMQALLTER